MLELISLFVLYGGLLSGKLLSLEGSIPTITQKGEKPSQQLQQNKPDIEIQ
jgi:hypothetical protein